MQHTTFLGLKLNLGCLFQQFKRPDRHKASAKISRKTPRFGSQTQDSRKFYKIPLEINWPHTNVVMETTSSNKKNRCPDMQRHTVELSNVIYNAASQRFEALATVHGGTEARKFACAIEAPIDMSFEDAATGLTTQALRRNAGRGGLSSKHMFHPSKVQRALRSVLPTKRSFDPFDMLRRLAA
jgi:hypothetical protein